MTITSAQMELRQRREATIREHIDAENHHDPNRAVATFSSYRASYDVPSMGEVGQPADANASDVANSDRMAARARRDDGMTRRIDRMTVSTATSV